MIGHRRKQRLESNSQKLKGVISEKECIEMVTKTKYGRNQANKKVAAIWQIKDVIEGFAKTTVHAGRNQA